MSTIKHNSTSHSRTSSSNKSHSSQKSTATKPNKGTEPAKDHGKDQKAEKKDGFSASKELDEAKRAKDAKDKGQDKDPKKAEEGKDQDSLLKKISDLQQQLDDMKKKKPEQPENLGGCCGKSHGSKKTEDPNQKDDPDSELTKLAVAILQGGKPQPAAGSKPGDGDKNGPKAISGNPAQLKSELSQKYQQYKQQGVQLRPETEQLVESALKGGTGATTTNPTNNPNPTNAKPTNQNQSKALAKAS
ncbi:hypothetical protein JST97_28670 [bacterium]|nr:hypothetical protein [bacterium]